MSELGIEPGPTPASSADELREPSDEGERQLKRVLGDLWDHSETLVRQEVALVKAEAEARLAHAKAALIRGTIAAGLFHAAYLTTLAAAVLILAQWLDAWLACLIVAALAITGAVVFAWLGKQEAEQAIEKPQLTPQTHQQQTPQTHQLTRRRAHT